MSLNRRQFLAGSLAAAAASAGLAACSSDSGSGGSADGTVTGWVLRTG